MTNLLLMPSSFALECFARKPKRTIRLESSERYVAEERANHPHLELLKHEILYLPFPVEFAEIHALMACRETVRLAPKSARLTVAASSGRLAVWKGRVNSLPFILSFEDPNQVFWAGRE